MLADAVEAASRTLVEPTPLKIRELIRKIFEDCLQDGQLDHTDLTLSDLRTVSESFLRILSNLTDRSLVRARCSIPVDKLDLILGRIAGHRDGFGFLIPDDGSDDRRLGW